MPSQKRRLPADPDQSAFPNADELVALAQRLADMAFYGDVDDYAREVEIANQRLSRAEVGFVSGYIACANAPPPDEPVLAAAGAT